MTLVPAKSVKGCGRELLGSQNRGILANYTHCFTWWQIFCRSFMYNYCFTKYIHDYYTLLHIALRGVANFDPSRILFYTVHPVFYPFTSCCSGWQVYTLHFYVCMLFFQIISITSITFYILFEGEWQIYTM